MRQSSPPLQAFTYKAQGIHNRIITPVLVAAAFDPLQPIPPGLKSEQVNALWDTGATKSAMDPSLAGRLGLASVGKVNVAHAGGNGLRDAYMVNLKLPNNVAVVGAHASEADVSAQGFDFLIGMDVFTLGDFALTHADGKTCMSFQMPAHKEIDFVQEVESLNRALQPKVGRNDPCPCGSGSKYKKCCGHPRKR